MQTVLLTCVETRKLCALKKRPDPLNGGMMRWSLPYNREICFCEGVVAHAYQRPSSLCGDSAVGTTEDAFWFTDDARQFTLHQNWYKDAMDSFLNRVEFCGRLIFLFTFLIFSLAR